MLLPTISRDLREEPLVPLPDVVVNRSSPVPLYFQVAEQLEHAIHEGLLVPGDRIGNEVALADQLGLSRPTLRQAIQMLVDKGMLVRKRGVGTQVVHAPIRRTVELTSLYDDLKRAGRHPRPSCSRWTGSAPTRRPPSGSTCRRARPSGSSSACATSTTSRSR